MFPPVTIISLIVAHWPFIVCLTKLHVSAEGGSDDPIFRDAAGRFEDDILSIILMWYLGAAIMALLMFFFFWFHAIQNTNASLWEVLGLSVLLFILAVAPRLLYVIE